MVQLNIDKKREYFLDIFQAAEKYYEKHGKRLAGEGWKEDWQTLFATILSAQTRDEVTIPVAESLFRKFNNLEAVANSDISGIKSIIQSVNYNNTKAKNIIAAAKWLIDNNNDNGTVPDTVDELVKIPGVGRKTANLVLGEIHNKDAICVDTHVHRISNVFGFVKTKNPKQTELELMKLVPKKYWSRINRVFVLWGKEVRGKDKQKFLEKINLKR